MARRSRSTQGILAIVAMVYNESKIGGVALPDALQLRCIAVLDAILAKVYIPWSGGEFEYDGKVMSCSVLKNPDGRVVMTDFAFHSASEKKYFFQHVFTSEGIPLSKVLVNIAHMLARPSRLAEKRKDDLMELIVFLSQYAQAATEVSINEAWWDELPPLALPDLEGPKKQRRRLRLCPLDPGTHAHGAMKLNCFRRLRPLFNTESEANRTRCLPRKLRTALGRVSERLYFHRARAARHSSAQNRLNRQPPHPHRHRG